MNFLNWRILQRMGSNEELNGRARGDICGHGLHINNLGASARYHNNHTPVHNCRSRTLQFYRNNQPIRCIRCLMGEWNVCGGRWCSVYGSSVQSNSMRTRIMHHTNGCRFSTNDFGRNLFFTNRSYVMHRIQKLKILSVFFVFENIAMSIENLVCKAYATVNGWRSTRW